MSHCPAVAENPKKPRFPVKFSKGKPPAPGKSGAKKKSSNVDFTVDDAGVRSAGKAPRKKSPPGKQSSGPTTPPRPTPAPDSLKLGTPGGAGFSKKQSGSARAARLLLALGPDQAGTILANMDEKEVEKVALEMARIDAIDPKEKEEILKEFRETVTDFEAPIRGGVDQAAQFLQAGLGDDRAREILTRINRRNLERDFEFLESIEPTVLAGTLGQEHHQITAVALSFIKPKIAAYVFKHLPEEYRSEVAMRIARTSKIHPDAIQGIAKVLREKFEKRAEEIFSETSGAETLANILNYTDRGTEDRVLDLLGKNAPEIVEDVKERLYTFEELASLEIKETRLLLSRVNDDLLLAAALRGAGEEIRRHFFNSLSQNRAADILEEIDRRGPISTREINEARSYILQIARRLDEEGTILIKKDKEEYV